MNRRNLATDPFQVQLSRAREHAQGGRWALAAQAFEQAHRLKPRSAEACLEIMPVLERLQRVEEAERFGHLAVRLRPSVATAHAWLGNMQVKLRKYPEAIGSFRRALLLDPSLTRIHEVLGFALSKLGLLEESLECLRRAVDAHPELSGAHSMLIFLMAFSAEVDAEALLVEARRWNQRHAEPLAARRRPFPHDRSPERRLRVGYVSPDFYDHVLRLYWSPLLRYHDRGEVEVVCYSSVRKPDTWTERLRELADGWHEVAELGDEALARRIREDQIDVLVDATMHMANSRLKVFAEAPAPVQICSIAYPGTTGIDTIQYRITDAFLDPPDGPQPYSESSLRLPRSFWCFEPADDAPEVGELPALARGTITFGSLNNFLKVNRKGLELWARVLARVPGSRLLLLTPEGPARKFVRDVLAEAGVSAERLEFVGVQPRHAYLETYRRIDIGLDCLPYNGHTTSLDAFFMGVPVVTLVGDRVVGRAGLSQARQLELAELVANHPDEFVEIAVRLARDLPRLAALRSELRARLTASPLMDAPSFVRDLERAYRQAWQKYCAEPVA
jgi:predicted O-linked N-acetylglucosamine transferase (SPINDLY family)